jgi:hypothetical protein
MMTTTKKLSPGVYQVVGTKYAVMNDSHNCWWVARIVDGIDSLDSDDRFFVGGSRNDAINYARELQSADN